MQRQYQYDTCKCQQLLFRSKLLFTLLFKPKYMYMSAYTTDAPAACNIGIQSPAVVFTARHTHHHPRWSLIIVNLVDQHLQLEQPAC